MSQHTMGSSPPQPMPPVPVSPVPVVRVMTVGAVVVVAVIAAVVSYSHMQQLAYEAGEDWRSWLIPLSIDGLVVAASMVLLTRRRHGLAGGPLAWGALGAGVVASLAANMADARPELTAVLVAGWPAVAFAVAFELLLQQRRSEAATPAQPVVPEPVVTPTSQPAYRWVEPVASTGVPRSVRPPHQVPAHEIHAVSVEVPVAPRVADLEDSAVPADPDPLPHRRPSPVPGPQPWSGGGDEDLVARVRRVIEVSTAAGARSPGRRALAKQLGVSEHQVRVALDLLGSATRPALDATSEARRVGHQSRGQ